MCLILFSWKTGDYRLLLAANRDEFYARPAERARWWADHPGIYGGRDLQAGGTWLAVDRDGRWAAVTNYREFPAPPVSGPSRGEIPTEFLSSGMEPGAFARALARRGKEYAGFNVLLGTPEELWYYGNRGGTARSLEPGVYGLSNHLLDTPWPKVAKGKEMLRQNLRLAQPADALKMGLLDSGMASDDQLPDTGIGLDWERRLSSAFIQSPEYGTRVSTVMILPEGGALDFYEWDHRGGDKVTERIILTQQDAE